MLSNQFFSALPSLKSTDTDSTDRLRAFSLLSRHAKPFHSSFIILFQKSLIIYIAVLLKATLRLSRLLRDSLLCYAIRSDQLFKA